MLGYLSGIEDILNEGDWARILNKNTMPERQIMSNQVLHIWNCEAADQQCRIIFGLLLSEPSNMELIDRRARQQTPLTHRDSGM
jgi:hypothetical protein